MRGKADGIRRARGIGLFSAVLCLFTSGEAAAYRTGADSRELGATGTVRWHRPQVDFVMTVGRPTDVPSNDVLDAVAAALSTWSRIDGSEFRFTLAGATSAHAHRDDGVNTIEFVQSGWAELGLAPQDAAGVTDISYVHSGEGMLEIVEADIYLNAEGMRWVARPPAPANFRDILSVVVHEAGHALGLMHTCEPDGALDAPTCPRTPTSPTETMYPLYVAGQETPEADDIAGVCFLYPDDGTPPIDGEVGPIYGEGGASSDGTECGSNCPAACMTNADCIAGEWCDAEQCTSLAPLGDSCGDADGCVSGFCSDGGFCTPKCTNASDCAVGETCSSGQCEGTRAGLGAECSGPSVCLGAKCLSGRTAHPICSRLCNDTSAVCPSGWSCASIDKEHVCVPTTDSEGCSLKRSHSHRRQYWAPMLFVLAALAIRRSVAA